MLRYKKGDKAKKGYYLNTANGELISLENDGAIPITIEGNLIRFPSPLALIAAPFVAIVYVVFLPLTGIIALLTLIVIRLGTIVSNKSNAT
jgi:hypothetical protein